MITWDAWLGGATLQPTPVAVTDNGDAAEPASQLPRLRVALEVGTQPSPTASAHVAVSGTVWRGEWALDLPYDALTWEAGVDLVLRGWVPVTAPGTRARPFADVAIGGRMVGLEQPWWADETRGGISLRLGAGVAVGTDSRRVQAAVRYEAVGAGLARVGTLESAAQDMTWTWTPSGGRLWVEVGAGLR